MPESFSDEPTIMLVPVENAIIGRTLVDPRDGEHRAVRDYMATNYRTFVWLEGVDEPLEYADPANQLVKAVYR